MIREVHYFEKKGPQNTETCVRIVKNLVEEGFKDVVVASTSGRTGFSFANALKTMGTNVVVVTHSAGFLQPSQKEISPEMVERIQGLGAKVFTGTILTHSIERSLAGEHQGLYPTLLIAETLRRFSQGVKVACEIVMEACDAGLLEEEKEVIAVGGTARGADTVCLILSAASKRFLKLRVLEILAKPR